MNEEDQVRHLLEEAGPRPEVPPEDLARIKAAFRTEWEEHVRRRRSPDRRLWLLAASLLLALGLGWWLWPSAPALETGPFPRAFDSLRLDADSRAIRLSASEIRLERGAVYVDSRTGTVVVHTPFGTVREIGTRFEVRLLEAALRVRVREGAVLAESHRVDAGMELILREDGSASRSPMASWGPDWSWVVQTAPPLRIEGLTLKDFLDQVARETGWTIRYEDPKVGGIVLHGDVEDLAPAQALEVVLPGAGLDYQLVDGVLVLKSPR
ncbi:MAG TPA: FecR family protein [Thermoanaerobaculia bacterium]|nr:FecR family protein [Thermoanaerobaculia bacterium]